MEVMDTEDYILHERKIFMGWGWNPRMVFQGLNICVSPKFMC